MTMDYVVKQKYLSGHGRNENLNSQKIRISEATVTHLIRDWKNRQQQHNNLERKETPIPAINAGTSQPLLELQQQVSSQSLVRRRD